METVYDHIPHVTFEDGSRIYYPEMKLETLKSNQVSWTVSRIMRDFKLYHNGALKLIGYAQEQGVLSKEEDYCGRFKVL